MFHIASDMEMFHSVNVSVDESRDISASVSVWARSGRYPSAALHFMTDEPDRSSYIGIPLVC